MPRACAMLAIEGDGIDHPKQPEKENQKKKNWRISRVYLFDGVGLFNETARYFFAHDLLRALNVASISTPSSDSGSMF